MVFDIVANGFVKDDGDTKNWDEFDDDGIGFEASPKNSSLILFWIL